MSSADSGGNAGAWEWWGDWAQTAASWFGGKDPLLNDRQRRVLRRAGYQQVSNRAWVSPAGTKIKGKKQLRAEIARIKQANAAGSVDYQPYQPIDDPVVFAAAAGGMSADQERIWRQRRMAADPKYREKELARLLRESEQRRRKATVRGKVDPQLKRARELLKRAGKLVVKDPKLAAKIARYGKAGGAQALLLGAFEIGSYIGGQIYKQGSTWYYGKKNVEPPKPAKQTSGRLTNIKITAKRLPEPVQPGAPRVSVSQGSPGAAARRLPAAKQQQAARTAPGKEDKLEEVTITAKPLPPVKAVPRWKSRLIWIQDMAKRAEQLRAELLRYKPLYDSIRSLQQPQQRSRSPAAMARPALQPAAAPLTALQPAAVQSRLCKPCKCSKRKKSGKPRCRNPVISRRKRNRDGVTVQTITRELRC